MTWASVALLLLGRSREVAWSRSSLLVAPHSQLSVLVTVLFTASVWQVNLNPGLLGQDGTLESLLENSTFQRELDDLLLHEFS